MPTRCLQLICCLGLLACEGKFSESTSTYKPRVLRRSDLNADGTINTNVAPAKDASGRYICDAPVYPAENAMRRISARQYRASIAAIFDGHATASADFPDSFGKSLTGFSTEEAINRLGESGIEDIMTAAEDTAESVAQNIASLSTCAAGRDCAIAFIEKYGQRALRGYLDDHARATLLSAYDGMITDGGAFPDGIAAIVALTLQMPRFLYQAEDASSSGRALTGLELANRLSFLVWDTGPDEALLAVADSLNDPAVLQAQAQRMLALPRSNGALVRFFREWTDTLELEVGGKDTAVFPQFDAALVSSMNESFSRFVTGHVASGGSLQTLLTSTTAHVDANMAPVFGVSAPASGWQAVELDATHYSGIFTQPAWLATQSHLAEASYVFRGRTIRRRLLCDGLGTPPGDAQAVFSAAPKPVDPTSKDLSAIVRANPVCSSCHDRIDPVGLAFEGFDAIGTKRTQYKSGKAIDPSGSATVFADEITFSDPVDLMQQLSESDSVRKCFSKQLFRFALSRQEQPRDLCAIQAIDDTLIATEGNLQQALVAITKTDAFKVRQDVQ